MKQLKFPDRLTQQFQTNVLEVLSPIEQNPISQGHFLNNMRLYSGMTNVVPTGLDAVLRGWIISRLSSNSIIWDSQNNNPTPAQNLWLNCSADCLVSIYVF